MPPFIIALVAAILDVEVLHEMEGGVLMLVEAITILKFYLTPKTL